MADKKISDLALLSAADLAPAVDYLPIVDPSEAAAADQNKRILVSSILTNAVDSGTLAAVSRVNPLQLSSRVAMTAAASGSNGIQVLDNEQVNFGTGNFTLHWEGSLPVWDGSTGFQNLIRKQIDASITFGCTLLVSGANPGQLGLLFYGSSGVSVDYYSTVATGLAANANAKVTASVTRQTASADGSVTFYVNGVQLGSVVTIPASAPDTVSNTIPLYISGGSVRRTASSTTGAILYNRALSATEVLSLCVNGPDPADIGASQTVLNVSSCVNGPGGNAYGTFSGASATGFTAADATGGVIDKRAGTADEITIVAGRRYSIAMTLVVNSGQRPFVSVRDTMTTGAYAATTVNDATIPASGVVTFVAEVSGTFVVYLRNSLASDFVVSDLTIKAIGITAQYNAQDAQSNTGQVFDSSGNGNHALLPAAGATVIPRRLKGEVRWTNTWDGTHELQYIGGVNQAILPANAYIESIIGTVSGATPHDIIIGDGSDTDRYVEITTGLAAGTTSFTLANRTTDGTNLKLTVDPDTDCVMSIKWVIRYSILEG
jgi:hypothetical protein